MRAALFVLLMACAGIARAQGVPEERHMQQYRERLAFYVAAGHSPDEIVTRMQNYFPWFGARFGVEFDRDGHARYFVTLGDGLEKTFFEFINK